MSDAPSKAACVLVAEDVPSVAALMRTLLLNRGYEVAMVRSGEECLALAKTRPPALILLDLMLTKPLGMEVLRRLKADPETAGIGVIACTSRKYKPDQDQARELGALAVISKPLNQQEFLGVVEQFFTGTGQVPVLDAAKAVGDPYLPAIASDRPHCRIWGSRGSIPVSGHHYVRHGGNTCCLEVANGKDTLIIDAGSGIRPLGLALARKGPCRLPIFITHTHWDHIQGFPFFVPAYLADFEIVIYGASGFRKDLKSVFRGQLDRDYFPVQFEDMQASIEVKELEGDEVQCGDFHVTWEFTHHPSATVGFKIRSGNRSVAYVTDNEFLYGYVGAPDALSLESELIAPHRRLVEFVRGADLLVMEAQYTNEEYLRKIGWGHSSLSNACLLAKLSQAQRWIVTHHDPEHDDRVLDRKLSLTREILQRLGCAIEVVHAYDGLTEYF